MKIAIIAYNLKIGGLTTVIMNVYTFLKVIKVINIELILLEDCEDNSIKNNDAIFDETKFKKNIFYKKIGKYYHLKQYLKKTQFDYILDFRYRINPLSEFLLVKYIYPKTKIIYTVHNAKIDKYLPNNKWLTKLLYSKAYKIVCVSKLNEILVLKHHKLKNTTTIYNAINLEEIDSRAKENIAFNFNYILAVGRIEEVKQFDKLIIAYSKSNALENNIKLVIVGDGSHLEYCKKLVDKLKLNKEVIFTGYSNNPYKYMKHAKFLVLCSKYEGFGLVLIESLACNTPVVSFDLLAGPNEIINNTNGLLVKNQDFKALTKAINKINTDTILYNKFKNNARDSVLRFSSHKIKNDWLKLLKIN